MAKPFCASLNFIDDFVAHYTGMTSDEIVDDVAKSMKAFVCKTPDDVTFGGKMVKKALDRIARRSPANRTNAYARWHKEGSVDLPSGGGARRAPETMGADPEAHAVESASGSSGILGQEQRPSGADGMPAPEKLSAGTPEAPVRKAGEGDKSPVLCTSGAPAMVSRKAAREAFEAFRKAYPGTRRGADVEWENFSRKNFPEDAPLLMPALLREKAHKEECSRVGAFCPPWANLATWINQRRWTQEFETPCAPQARKTSEDLENDKKARMLRWLKDREAGIPTGDNYDEIPEVENTEDGNA